ncbi:MAG TPA: hypothetical protein VEG08_05395 [Terriglobales bacterium]|nr:hypothetical protein [Terriglobales bacterium]
MSQTARRRFGSAAALLLALWLVVPATAAEKDKRQVLQQARGSYYSLNAHGFSDFQCTTTPDWEALLQDLRKSDPARADRTVALLKQIQFTVKFDTAGSTKVTHTSVPAENDEMAKGLNQIYGGAEQAISGFFDTWSPFMLTSPFPAVDSEYQLDDQGGEWSLSYKEGTSDVVTTMGKDLVIHELRIISPEFRSSIRPQFLTSREGLLLAGYQADYQGKTPEDATALTVKIDYQEVNGLPLPRTLDVSGSQAGSPFRVSFSFSGCQANRH